MRHGRSAVDDTIITPYSWLAWKGQQMNKLHINSKNQAETKPTDNRQSRKEPKVPKPWQHLIGQLVEIYTTSGRTLRGTLQAVYSYELVLDTKAHGAILIGKGRCESCHRLGGES